MKFTGHERDLANLAGPGDDLDYMHARFYSPVTGRFGSMDPINSAQPKHPQSWNKYAYVLDNPSNFRDPTGKCVEDLCIGEFVLGGIVIGELIADAAATGYLITRIHDVYTRYNEAKEDEATKGQKPGRSTESSERRKRRRATSIGRSETPTVSSRKDGSSSTPRPATVYFLEAIES